MPVSFVLFVQHSFKAPTCSCVGKDMIDERRTNRSYRMMKDGKRLTPVAVTDAGRFCYNTCVTVLAPC